MMHRSFTTAASRSILHHEWIRGGTSLRNGKDTHTVLFLHGLLGSGKNLKTPARHLVKRHPHLSILLLDARGHGQSSSSSIHPPHTISNCATDVINTVTHLGLTQKNSPYGIIGHSFGGRIALSYLHALSSAEDSVNVVVRPPQTTWLLDTVPGEAHGSVADVVHALSDVVTPIPCRKTLVTDLNERKGLAMGIARWMTTNTIPSDCGKGLNFAFDLNVVRDILKDFSNQKFYDILKDVQGRNLTSTSTSEVNLVRAGRNGAWTEDILKELEGFDEEFLKLHILKNAGHWVHVDDLDGLLDIMEGSFKCSNDDSLLQ